MGTRQVPLTGIVQAVALVALTAGLFANVPVLYLLPPFVILVSAITIWEAWKESRRADTAEDVAARPPAFWVLAAFAQGLAAVAVGYLVWRYFS
ncbi:MAG TPA: hypothetical protein VFM13_07325 [Gaiellaceae bacterium]|nr:hypothetical protein [Gaiellaceae bacterium]